MINYFYDEKTLEYKGSAKATIDRLETEKQGLPCYFKLPNCTTKKPLKNTKGYAVVFNKEADDWEHIEDHRGHKFYLKNDREAYAITKLGPLPDDILDTIDIDIRRQDAWNTAKDIRSDKDMAPVGHAGEIYDVDSDAWQNLQDARLRSTLPDAPAMRSWTTADNTQVVIDSDDIIAIIKSKIDRKDNLYAASQMVREEIYKSNNPEEIDILELYNRILKDVI